MPVKPQPFTLYCPTCKWEKYCAPVSDVILPDEIPQRCPRCGEVLLHHLEHSGGLKEFAQWLRINIGL